MKVEQPKLGRKGTLLLLVFLGAFPPLTMDLYLPALPQMAEMFATSRGMVNLTIGAALIQFCGILMGAAGIQIVSADSHDLIRNYGALLIVIGTTCAVLWLMVQHRPFVAEKLYQPS